MKSISKRKKRSSVHKVLVSSTMLDARAAIQRPVAEKVVVHREDASTQAIAIAQAVSHIRDRHPSWNTLKAKIIR